MDPWLGKSLHIVHCMLNQLMSSDGWAPRRCDGTKLRDYMYLANAQSIHDADGPMMSPCCEWLGNMIQVAGDSGVSVVASREGGSRQFFLQAQSLTRSQSLRWDQLARTGALKSMSPLFEDEQGRLVPIHTLMRVPLQYCPHCGVRLDKLIGRQREEFDCLAEAHRPLALE